MPESSSVARPTVQGFFDPNTNTVSYIVHDPATGAAAILDPVAREIRFVSCGHTAPYLCRPTETAVELHALVGRGNPLG